MTKFKVAIVKFETPIGSVGKAVDYSHGLNHLPPKANVFIKPNIVFWTRTSTFPKWGVVTTSRVVEDMVILLKERGIDQITILEGITTFDPKDVDTPAHAFESLGYNILKRRYGVKTLNIFERPFRKIDLGGGVILNFNEDILQSDFVINLPVLKTHTQTIVSLGIKNLKGLIDVNSRKRCHSAHPEMDLNYMIARLANRIPPSFTLIDGIYTSEQGPFFAGRLRRSNLLIASSDIFSADKVGAMVLGYHPSEIPHLVHAAQNLGRSIDLSDIEIVGERIEDVASRHEFTFPYTEDGHLPKPLEKLGIQGLSLRKYDNTLCTYCSGFPMVIAVAIAKWWKGETIHDVEILTGKVMKPTPGKKKTILIGKCMVKANKGHPHINEMIAIKGCPPSLEETLKGLHQAGIHVSPKYFENMDMGSDFYMKRYEGRVEFEESFFRII